jgi:hypothetical protein
MAEWFLKVKAHTEDHPVYTKAKQLLQAIESLIPSKTAVLYYAAILDILTNSSDPLTTEAAVQLLACILQGVPFSLIQKEREAIVSNAVGRMDSESVFIGKYVVKILERVAQAMPREFWLTQNGAQSIDTFFELMSSPNSISRKQTVSSLVKLLSKGLASIPEVVQYIVQKCKDLMTLERIHNYSIESIAHSQYFLCAALQILSLDYVLQLAPDVISLANLHNSIVSTQAYLCLETLFASRKLPRDVIGTYLKAILSNPPLTGGVEALQIAYIQSLSQAISNFNQADSLECYRIISDGISTLSEYLLSDQEHVQNASARAINSVIMRCFNESYVPSLSPEEELALSFDVLALGGKKEPLPIERITARIVYLLNDRFVDILPEIFPITQSFVQKLGPHAVKVTGRVVQELDKWGVKFYSHEAFRKAIGAALNTLGPIQFFTLLPMNIEGIPLDDDTYSERSRSWLLPIISEQLEKGDVTLYLTYFFSTAKRLEKIRKHMELQGFEARQRKYMILIAQIWETFPNFCKNSNTGTFNPSLLEKALPVLANIISNNFGFTKYILSGLTFLIESELSVISNCFITVQEKFLPLLFNTYLEKMQSKEMLKFIDKYPISPEFANRMLRRLLQRILENMQNGNMQASHLLMDLLTCIILKLGEVSAEDKVLIQRFTTTFLQSTDGDMQKRAYKLTYKLGTQDRSFAQQILDLSELVSCSEKARLQRLKLIHYLHFSVDLDSFTNGVKNILPEILLNIKSNKTKTRKFAQQYVVDISNRMMEVSKCMEFLGILMAGLASGIDNTVSATLEAIAKVLTHIFSQEIHANPLGFGDDVELAKQNFLREMAETGILLVSHKSKEVSKSGLKMMKNILSYLQPNTVRGVVKLLLDAIFNLEASRRDSLKVYIRYIIEKLIKKIGLAELDGLFPESHKKLLHYVSKQIKRKRKKSDKKKKPEEMEDGDDINMETLEDSVVSSKKPAAVKLPNEYHFLNPLDIPAMPKIKGQATPQSKSDIKVVNGKMIISEDKQKRGRDDSSDEDEESNKTSRLLKKRKVEDEGIIVSQSGEDFKSTRAKGDITRSSKQQPFAYIQFNPKMLNKRKKVKVSSKIESLVSTAKQGAFKGLKSRKKKS